MYWKDVLLSELRTFSQAVSCLLNFTIFCHANVPYFHVIRSFVVFSPLSYSGGVRDVPTNSAILLPSRGRVSFPSRWVWAELNNLFLRNRIWQKWWDVTSKIRLEKDWGFHLGCVHSHSRSLFLESLTPGEASCHDVSSPMEMFTWEETEASCQWPVRNWNLPRTTCVHLEADSPAPV